MTKILNFCGAAGAGKTVLSCLLFAELKIRGYKVEYVPEIAKNLVWTEQFDLLNNQHYVSTKQFDLLNAIYGKVDFIVTDGPLVHGIYYNRHNKDNFCNVEKVEKIILDYMSKFENIYIHVTKGKFPYEQAGRLQTEEESNVISLQMKEILDSLNIPYLSIISSKAAVKDILAVVTKFERKEKIHVVRHTAQPDVETSVDNEQVMNLSV